MTAPLCMEGDAPATYIDARGDAADTRGPMAYCAEHAPPGAVPIGEWSGPVTGGRLAPRLAGPVDDGQPTMG